jgi:hypothetical protein
MAEAQWRERVAPMQTPRAELERLLASFVLSTSITASFHALANKGTSGDLIPARHAMTLRGRGNMMQVTTATP